MLDTALDVFRMRQYFDMAVRGRQLLGEVRRDAAFVDLVRRSLLPLPVDRRSPVDPRPFPPLRHRSLPGLGGRKVAVVATGGSGALASVVGIGRALEEVGVRPDSITVCSGSALFGFPLAAGVPADEVAAFTIGLGPGDYSDLDWGRLLRILPTAGRGFAGLIRGERLERSYKRLLGDMTLGELPVACYAPIWNVEENRIEYIGPATYPEMTVAHAVRMAVALPLFFDPVALDGGSWCDGGIVDIFPVHPVLDIVEGPSPDVVLAVNGFYPPGFAGERVEGWRARPFSILEVASQVRTSQQAQLARENLARLQAATRVELLEPVPYEVVMGAGFYRQFLDHGDWPQFMASGRRAALAALRRVAGSWAATDGRRHRPLVASRS